MKLALVMKKDEFLKQFDTNTEEDKTKPNMVYISEGSFAFTTGLFSRSFCETDENYVQLLPYITLKDKDTGDIFVYTRGKLGEEGRLHGKCSIGLGGHIEEEPTDNTPEKLKEVCLDNIKRELEEEVGLVLGESSDVIAMFNNSILLHVNFDDVCKTHIALAITIGVDRKSLGSFEGGVIEKGKWMTVKDILNDVGNGKILLEPWSEVLVSRMVIDK